MELPIVDRKIPINVQEKIFFIALYFKILNNNNETEKRVEANGFN